MSTLGTAGFCCESMREHLDYMCSRHENKYDCPDQLIIKTKHSFGMIIHDGGTSFVEIMFCPFCGGELKGFLDA